jgi:1,2-diacylglycerol 3-alpha-glucosyltransferase
MRKRIGFLSYWNIGRGLAQVTLNYVKTLQDDYDIYILKQNTLGSSNLLKDESFDSVNVNITEYPEYVIPDEFFTKWITDNKLDAVFFNEYKQWTNEESNLVKVAKSLGCKVYGYLVLEKFNKDLTKDYDRILSPTVSHTRFMRENSVRNFTYVPYSIDFKEFPDLKEPARNFNKRFTFFHPAGMGGVSDRKNTKKVIEAFLLLNNKDTELIVSSQKPINIAGLPSFAGQLTILDKNLSRKELIDLYYKADCLVNPSKWETIGIPILEALASGTPVITTDAPPMNEFVNEGKNGYLCKPNMVRYETIEVPVAEITAKEIKNKMECVLNKDLYPILSKNSRFIAEKLYDLEKNKHYLLDLLKKELGE